MFSVQNSLIVDPETGMATRPFWHFLNQMGGPQSDSLLSRMNDVEPRVSAAEVTISAHSVTLAEHTVTLSAHTVQISANTAAIATVSATLAAFPEFIAGQSQYAGGMSVTATADQNTLALNACISAAAANGGGRVMLPHGVCLVNAIDAPAFNNVTIVGQGQFGGSTLSFSNATGDCITLSTWGHLGIENVYITANVRRTSGWAIKVTGTPFRPQIRDVRIDYHYNGIWIDTAGEVEVSGVNFRYMHGTRGILVGGVNNGVYRYTVKDIRADNPYPSTYGTVATYTVTTAVAANTITVSGGKIWQTVAGGTTGAASAPTTIPGTGAADAFTSTVTDGTVAWNFVCDSSLIWILVDSYAYSGYLSGLPLINGAYAFLMNDGLATGVSHPIWCWVEDLEGDHNFYDTVSLAGGESFRAINSWFGSAQQGNGLTIGPSFKGEIIIDSTRIAGAWLHGVLWYPGPVGIRLTNNDIGHNSVVLSAAAHGIYVVSAVVNGLIEGNNIGPLAISGWAAAPNKQGYAIYMEPGATDNIRITDNDMRGNALGPISNGSTGTSVVIDNNLPIVINDPILYSTPNISVTAGTYTVSVLHAGATFSVSSTVTLPTTTTQAGRWWHARTITAALVVSVTANVTPRAGGAASTFILSAVAGAWADLQMKSDGTWQIERSI